MPKFIFAKNQNEMYKTADLLEEKKYKVKSEDKNYILLRKNAYGNILIHIAKIYSVSTDYLLGIEHKREIDLSGLSQEEVEALLNLIKAMKRN